MGVAVGAGAVALALAGLVFVRCRKRRNRRLRLEGGRSIGGSGSGSSNPFGIPSSQLHDGPASPLSFRCQTSLSPRSPDFRTSISGGGAAVGGEKSSTSPISPPMTPSAVWGPRQSSRQSSRDPDAKNRDRTMPALHSLTTNMPAPVAAPAPAFPGSVHYSSTTTSPKTKAAAMPFAPFSPDDDLVPTSTVSTRSTTQLLPLRPYNPADYGYGSSAGSPSPSQHRAFSGVEAKISSPESAYTSPISGSTTSPLLSRVWEQQQQQQPGRGAGEKSAPVWDMPPRRERQSSGGNIAGALGRATLAVAGKGGRRVSGGGNCSPLETTQINTVFPAPPTKR